MSGLDTLLLIALCVFLFFSGYRAGRRSPMVVPPSPPEDERRSGPVVVDLSRFVVKNENGLHAHGNRKHEP